MKKDSAKQHDNMWLGIITMAVIYFVLVAGILAFRFYLGRLWKENTGEKYEQYYVMITDDRNASFWRSVYQGAYERGLEENVYVDMLGRDLSREYSRNELMQIAIASEVDGIIVTADESGEMTELIDEASASGIPVVTLNSDNTRSGRCSFVGVGSYNLGREYGRQVLKILNNRNYMCYVSTFSGEKYTIEVGTEQRPAVVAVLVNANASDTGQNILCSGIQDAIDQERAADKEIRISLIGIDNTNPFSAEESIRDVFMQAEIPDIIVCLNETDTNSVYQAVVDYNKVGQVGILGYYDSDAILRGIERNVINATISVDTKQMGGFCVDALTEYHRYGNTSQYLTADVTLIDESNVADYAEGR